MTLIKNHSLRTKMLLINTSIFFVMLLIIIGANYYFIDDYYYIYTKNNISEVFESLDIGNNMTPKMINELQMKTGYEVFTVDADNQVIGDGMDSMAGGLPLEEDIISLREVTKKKGEVYFTLFKGEMSRDVQMFFLMELEDDSLLLLHRNTGIIKEVQQIFMNFLVGITVVVYLVSFVAIYFIAGRMVKPILNLKDAAEKIAAMEFDTPIIPGGNDEIGALVESVNLMAGNLSRNLEALNESNHRLEMELSSEKNLETMRRRFVSDVSHELKNPISVIIAYSEGLVMKIPKSTEAIEHYYSIILEEGKKMNQLVKDLLDLSAYQSGTFSMTKEMVCLEDVVRNGLERFELKLDEKKVVTEIIGTDEHHVIGNQLRLDQVVTNLLGNAIKYAEVGGLLKVTFEDKEKTVVMRLANSGPLIPDAELDNIWKSFYQLDTDSEGNGLGLAITKSIVEMHNGTISAYVSEGLNCFEVRLPRALPRD